jgi:BirA family transcriptional regulator, biotin operon repressor / biotin---[acetyl-CoA-carboxylase] ligase
VTARISRLDRFGRIGSTQDVVRAWLAQGVPEICVAVADEQTAGRGRLDRTWEAPAGAALLASAGFRPIDLAPEHGWRLGAIVALAMLDAIDAEHGAAASGIALKWPNDLVARRDGRILKLGGVLGEAVPDDGRLEAAIVGIGLNVDWRSEAFPPELASTMTSVREVVRAPVDRDRLLAAWLHRLGPAYDELRGGAFPAERWAERQVTTGARVEVDVGGVLHGGTAVGVDLESGGLLVRGDGGAVRTFLYGEVVRCRLHGVEADL